MSGGARHGQDRPARRMRPIAHIVTRNTRPTAARPAAAPSVSSPRTMSVDVERRGQHPVGGLGVLVLEEEVEGRVEHAPVHGGHRHHPRRDELVVLDRAVRARELRRTRLPTPTPIENR